MRFVIFTHSLVSDWNHGNAHFLRGIASELLSRGHELDILEPRNGWSRQNLLRNYGQVAIDEFTRAFPHLRSTPYDEETIDLRRTLHRADVVIVHEWNSPELISKIGQHRASHDYVLFFHDTHHRSVTERDSIARLDLANFDAVLAYGGVIRDAYLSNGWARCAWTWHEAADTRVFRPISGSTKRGDLVWIGNWGDGERADELREFLVQPVKRLGLRACVYGVRYPAEALRELDDAGIEYGGWLPNYKVPEIFGQYRLTIHIPRRPYVEALPGIPTIRPFEALACGIPLICAPWEDREGLFSPGKDFLAAEDAASMTSRLGNLVHDESLCERLREHGLQTIRSRHTCTHRVNELFSFIRAAQEAAAALEGA
jgi:spore maturation protein CgeB